jgi:hypothetical protein
MRVAPSQDNACCRCGSLPQSCDSAGILELEGNRIGFQQITLSSRGKIDLLQSMEEKARGEKE